jgi:branched-chain amino acid transport system permease protein
MIHVVQAIVSGILIGGVYGLFSIGLTLILGVTRLTNFAHGEFIMLGMYLTYVAFTYFSINPYLSIVIVAPLMYLFGLVIYRLLYRKVLSQSELVQIVLTVALSLVIQTAMMMIFTPNIRSISTPYAQTFYHLGPFFVNQAQLIAFLIVIACSIALSLFLTRTDLGKAIRATVDDREMALMIGINIQKIYALPVGLGSALAGVAGAVILTYFPLFPTVGATFLVMAFVSIVMGGMGSVMGALIGGMLVGITQQVSTVYLPYDLQNGTLFVLFITFLLFRPTGLMGRRLTYE